MDRSVNFRAENSYWMSTEAGKRPLFLLWVSVILDSASVVSQRRIESIVGIFAYVEAIPASFIFSVSLHTLVFLLGYVNIPFAIH